MKSLKSRVAAVGSVLLLAGGLTLAGAPAANATEVSYGCGLVRGLHNTYQASTKEMSGNCGTVGARARYTHPGGSSWSTWSYDFSLAIRQANNTYAGEHSSSGGTFPS